MTLLALAGIAALAAGPAYAQSVGGDIGGFIQNIIDILTSSVVRGLAIIAVILIGIAWMYGHIDMRRAGSMIIGIIVSLSAATIVDMISGSGGA